MTRLLAALRRRPAPAPGPSGLVVVRLLHKHVEAHGAVLNAGEIAGFSPAQAAALIRAGDAVPCGPDAVSTVRPREDSIETYRLCARAATDEATWSAPSGDLGETILRWPPRAAMNDRTPRR